MLRVGGKVDDAFIYIFIPFAVGAAIAGRLSGVRLASSHNVSVLRHGIVLAVGTIQNALHAWRVRLPVRRGGPGAIRVLVIGMALSEHFCAAVGGGARGRLTASEGFLHIRAEPGVFREEAASRSVSNIPRVRRIGGRRDRGRGERGRDAREREGGDHGAAARETGHDEVLCVGRGRRGVVVRRQGAGSWRVIQ